MPTRPRARRRYAPRLPPEERREQLLDAALALIAEHGHNGVSMEAVARHVGVTKPVVYGVFSDRGALLHALLEREEMRALAQLGEALPFGATGAELEPDALVVEGLRAFLQAVAESPDRWRMILLPVDGTPPIVREHVEAGRRQIARQLKELVTRWVERRGGPEDLDEELVALAMLTLGESAAKLVLSDPERYGPERFAGFGRQLVALLP